MAHLQHYIAQNADFPQQTASLARSIERLGFHPIREIPKSVSLHEIHQGARRYDQLTQHLLIDVKAHNEPARLLFVFRAVRKPYRDQFKLLDIEVRLVTHHADPQSAVHVQAYNRSKGFKVKSQMIQRMTRKARQHSPAQTAIIGHLQAAIPKTVPPMQSSP